jgi:hypothetical protein
MAGSVFKDLCIELEDTLPNVIYKQVPLTQSDNDVVFAWIELQGYLIFIEVYIRNDFKSYGEITIPSDFPRSWLLRTETTCLKQYRITNAQSSWQDLFSWIKTTITTISRNAARIGTSQPEPTHASSCHGQDRPKVCPEAGLDYRNSEQEYIIKLRPTQLYPRLTHPIHDCTECLEKFKNDEKFRKIFTKL